MSDSWIEIDVTENTIPEHMWRAEMAMPLYTTYLARTLKEFLGEYAPRGETGYLKDSFEMRWRSRESYLVFSTAHYSNFVAEGTGEYVGNGPITPDTAGALKFFWPKVGAMTVWKGNLPTPNARVQFIEWAHEHGMMPFLAWPKGQTENLYPEQAILSTKYGSAEFLLDRALEDMGAK